MAREEMVSPELQQAAIEAYCDQHNIDLIDTIPDLDKTGRNFARAGVQRAIEMVERNEADVVVVWKVSRFGRNTKDWHVHADRLEVAGGSLESATEQFDPLTSTGRLTRGMLVELASWESDVKSEQWKEAHAHRFRQGKTHNGGKRFGYIYDKAQQIHVPDPETGPVLAEIYRRYVAGQTGEAICTWLNSIGVTTTSGAAWTASTLRHMLEKGFGAGYVYRANRPTRGGRRLKQPELLPGAHQPVIDQKTWQAYLRRKKVNAKVPGRARSGVNPLTGLVVCGRDGCEMTMNIWQGWAKTGHDTRKFYRAYKCYRGCKHNYVGLPVLIEAVKAWLEAEVAADLDQRAETKAKQMAKRVIIKSDRAEIVRQIKDADKALTRLADGWARGITPESAYKAASEALVAEKQGLEGRLAQLDLDVDATRTNVRPLAQSVLRDFDALIEKNPAGMREVLHSMIREIRVLPGKASDKVTVISKWD